MRDMRTKDPQRYEHWPTYKTDRRQKSGEGRIGGPCHAVNADGYFCTRKATVIKDDGYAYCPRHA